MCLDPKDIVFEKLEESS
jgi:hypothetical protein